MARVDRSGSGVGTKVGGGGSGDGVSQTKPSRPLPFASIGGPPILFSPQTQSLGKIRYLQLALLSDAPCVVVLSK